jgi:hypothetical protein
MNLDKYQGAADVNRMTELGNSYAIRGIYLCPFYMYGCGRRSPQPFRLEDRQIVRDW